MNSNFVTLTVSAFEITFWVLLIGVLVILWVLFIRWLIYEDRHGRGIRGWIRHKKMMKEIYKEREQRAYENEMWRREQERKAKEENRKNKF